MQSNYGRPKLYEYMEISSISCKAYQGSMFKWYHRGIPPIIIQLTGSWWSIIYICMWKHFHKFLTCNFDTKFLKVLICCFWEKISCMAITYKNTYVNGKHENIHTKKNHSFKSIITWSSDFCSVLVPLNNESKFC